MSIITVQLGQCGNQIGSSLFSLISKECFGPDKKQPQGRHDRFCSEIFFDPPDVRDEGSLPMARAVLVDSERKVISQVLDKVDRGGRWRYDRNSQISFRKGSGNNWAHGYCSYGPKIESSFEEAVRRQVERCDRLSGFLSLMSLAGGTGSGTGAYLSDHLRDHYPSNLLVNQVVWPYSSGEVSVQSLNAVLSLAHVQRSTDVVLGFDNDSLHAACKSLLSAKKVSFSDVNEVLVKQLAHALLPTSALPRISDPLNDLVASLAPHPEYKMVSATMAPVLSDDVLSFTTYHWPAILKELCQLRSAKFAPDKFDAEWQLKYSFDTRRDKSFAHLLICRGPDAPDQAGSILRDERFQSIRRYPSFNPDGFHVRSHAKPFCRMDKSAVLLSNDSSQMAHVDRVVDRAWAMFTSRAYVHQYKRYGLEEGDFVDCFVALEQLLCSYANL